MDKHRISIYLKNAEKRLASRNVQPDTAWIMVVHINDTNNCRNTGIGIKMRQKFNIYNLMKRIGSNRRPSHSFCVNDYFANTRGSICEYIFPSTTEQSNPDISRSNSPNPVRASPIQQTILQTTWIREGSGYDKTSMDSSLINQTRDYNKRNQWSMMTMRHGGNNTISYIVDCCTIRSRQSTMERARKMAKEMKEKRHALGILSSYPTTSQARREINIQEIKTFLQYTRAQIVILLDRSNDRFKSINLFSVVLFNDNIPCARTCYKGNSYTNNITIFYILRYTRWWEENFKRKSFVTDDVLAQRFRLFFHVYDRFLVSSDYEVDFISLKMTRAL